MMPFDWEQSAFLGYAAEQTEKEENDEEEEDNNLFFW